MFLCKAQGYLVFQRSIDLGVRGCMKGVLVAIMKRTTPKNIVHERADEVDGFKDILHMVQKRMGAGVHERLPNLVRATWQGMGARTILLWCVARDEGSLHRG